MAKKPHSHQNFASDFKGQTELFERVVLFKATLPPGNWLEVFMTSEEIDFTVDDLAKVAAIGFDNIKNTQAGIAHNEIQLRNRSMNPIISHMKGGFQFLKAANPTNYSKLSFWGAIISVNGKLTYPSRPEDKLDMFGVYAGKDGSYPVGTSPLQPYNTQNEIVMADDLDAMTAANLNVTNAFNAFNLSEENTMLRNRKWAPVLVDLVKIYNYAKAYYRNNSRSLGLMGFIIVATAPTHKVQKSTALQGAHVLIHGAIIGSIINNPNAWDVLIYPGKDMTKPPVTLKANTSMAVAKGMSSFVMQNPDALRIAKITTTVRK
jgi:hypothetical protein